MKLSPHCLCVHHRRVAIVGSPQAVVVVAQQPTLLLEEVKLVDERRLQDGNLYGVVESTTTMLYTDTLDS
jgi:hypothetical protein